MGQMIAADVRPGGAPHGEQAPTQIITLFVPGTRRANSSLSFSQDWVEVEGIAHASGGSGLRLPSPPLHASPAFEGSPRWPGAIGRTPAVQKYSARQATEHFGRCSFLGRK